MPTSHRWSRRTKSSEISGLGGRGSNGADRAGGRMLRRIEGAGRVRRQNEQRKLSRRQRLRLWSTLRHGGEPEHLREGGMSSRKRTVLQERAVQIEHVR